MSSNLSLYETLIRSSLESKDDEPARQEGLSGGVKRDDEVGLTPQSEVPIVLVADMNDTDTLGRIVSSLESAGHTVRLVHTDVYSSEAVNSSNGIDTVVRKLAPPSGRGGAVAKMDMMEYRTIRVVRPWDLLEAIEKEREVLYVEDPELAQHLTDEGYSVSSNTDDMIREVGEQIA